MVLNKGEGANEIVVTDRVEFCLREGAEEAVAFGWVLLNKGKGTGVVVVTA